MLVEFESGRSPSYFDLVGMEQDLSAMLGRKVDLRTAQELSRYFRDEVVATAAVQYEGG
jgi:predicted nucleotidyltransferase